jgi:hypothetical protein
LEDYYCERTVMDDTYNFGFEEYRIPAFESRDEYLDHIK